MSKHKSSNSKQRRELDEDEQHDYVRARIAREELEEMRRIDRALKTKDFDALIREEY